MNISIQINCTPVDTPPAKGKGRAVNDVATVICGTRRGPVSPLRCLTSPPPPPPLPPPLELGCLRLFVEPQKFCAPQG